MKYVFNFEGTRVESLNWWGGGITRQAKLWRIREAKRERMTMVQFFKCQNDFKVPENGKIKITLHRIYSTRFERIYDRDDFIGGCKHLRDGIAEGLGFKSDNNKRLEWEYKQEKTKSMVNNFKIIVEVK